MLRAILAAAVLGMLGAALLSTRIPPRAVAHGVVDQTLAGDPPCSLLSFKGAVSGAGALRQEVVLATTSMVAVDLCLLGLLPTSVTVNIRSGTASSPGPILESGSASVGTSLGYVHVDLSSALATTVGSKLVIEIPNALTVQWQGTCGAISGNCLALDPDLYPAGVSNSALVGDFAFRTYAAAAATATASPTDTPTGTPTPTDAATNTATASPTATDTPTATSTATDTPTQVILAGWAALGRCPITHASRLARRDSERCRRPDG